ncbi:MAG TPA: hypothetical protein EYQ24_14480 [Bacteroidetes bacterium]|nr:hypothetical protein [Bacteroidota bacterium]
MNRLALSFLALSLPLAACGGGDSDADTVQETGAPESAIGQMMQGVDAMRGMAEQAEEMQNTQPAEPVNHRVLLEMLPDEAAGMPQTETEGQSQNMGAFALSTREATYADSTGDSQLTITVADYGAFPAIGMFGLGWTMVDMDKETSTGYERTITYQGHRGYRKYDTESRRGELSALIEGRYHVQVSGRDVDDEQLEAALQSVDTRRLASMKDEGRPSA